MKASLRPSSQQTGRWGGQISDHWENGSQMEGTARVKVLGHKRGWPVQRMEWKVVQMVFRGKGGRWEIRAISAGSVSSTDLSENRPDVVLLT